MPRILLYSSGLFVICKQAVLFAPATKPCAHTSCICCSLSARLALISVTPFIFTFGGAVTALYPCGISPVKYVSELSVRFCNSTSSFASKLSSVSRSACRYSLSLASNSSIRVNAFSKDGMVTSVNPHTR